MKKSLTLLVALFFPFLLFAQLMDTTTVFYENFDGSSIQTTTNYSSSFGGANGDWQICNTLYKSAPNSYHTPVYATGGNSQMYTAAIPVTSNDFTVNRIYLAFDHICKVSQLDQTNIHYSLATGVDADGNYIWTSWQSLNFGTDTAWYYGDGAGNKGTVTGGKFNHQSYTEWQSSNNSATPNNTWWKHEYFDLTSKVLRTAGVTHVRFRFQDNKSSTTSSGTQACAGWYVDNIQIILSNCELELPKLTLTNPIYVNKNNLLKNNIGPYVINATISDNDTLNLNSLEFKYKINSGNEVTVPNTILTNIRTGGRHQVTAKWDLPTICYYDTIRYHISVMDVHGSSAVSIDTPMIAWHDQTNISNNNCALDSLNTFPHCFITGVAEPVTVYFKNKSDAVHSQSTGSPYQTSLNVTLKVENENHVQTHISSHNWTGSLCFDERDFLSLGQFTPSHGVNYITVYINTRNGQVDGNHTNDTIKYVGYACDSLLHGDYTIGGANPDFATMADAKLALSYCGINGPTTFHLRPGTYQDFDFRSNYPGQSETNTITFQGDNVNTVIVTNNHADTNTNVYGAVTLINPVNTTTLSNFRFKNLTIQGNNAAVSRGVVIRGNACTDVVFDGCIITANPTNTTVNTSVVFGRTVAPTSTPDEVKLQNCTLTGGNYGIYYLGTSARRNTLEVANCNINSCYRGVQTSYTNTNIHNNHITQYNMTTHQNFSGLYLENTVGADVNGNLIDNTYDAEYGIFFKGATVSDFYVRNNKIRVGNSNYGLHIESCSSTATDTGYVYNNEVILYPVVAANSYAVQIKSSNFMKVANNSFYIKSDAPYSNTAALRIENNSTTFFNNNILMNYSNCSDNTNYPLYLNGTSLVNGSYNDLVSASGVVAYKTVVRNNVAEFESANPTATNTISLLPPMTSPVDSLLPTSFDGFECGKNADVDVDIRGITRYALTYMGAYADQVNLTDAAVTAMVSPASGECPQNTYNITVNLANKGASALNFAQHNAVLKVHSDTLNLNNSINITSGTIPVLGSITSAAVASNVSIPVNQMIDFTFILTTNGDNNRVNDTLKTFFILEAAIPDYEEDFSGGTVQTWTISQIAGAGNWTFQEATGVNPAIAPVYGTGRLFFNAKNFANNTESRAVMPVVNLANAVNPILEVWFAHDNTSNKTGEGVTVKVSTDGGSTFSDIIPQGQTTSLLKRYLATATTPQWTLYTYDLSDYTSNGCIYIAFDAKGQVGNNINIDRIRLRSLFNNDIAVTNVYAQGETPAQYGMQGVVSALVRNEGRQTQNNVKVYLTVNGAVEQYRDSLTIPSLATGAQTIVTFPNHLYNVEELKNVEVRSRNDQYNANNAVNWRMDVTNNVVNYADTSVVGVLTGDYNNVIRPCVRYKTSEELTVKAVKYYYDQTYIADPNNGFRAFVSNEDGQVVATSDLIQFNTLQQGAWNIIPIQNFALTNMQNFYVGIEMLAHGDYLCSQVETPLRDSTFYFLNNGTYTPQTFGRFMIGAVVDTPFVHDLAILELNNPTSRCDLGHENITVTITNNGSQDILPGTVFNYSVNGQTAVSQTLTETLASHQTSTFVFNTQYDFTNNQVNVDDTYNVKVWIVKDAQDRLQFNDTLQVNVVSLGKSATPVVAQDTVNVNYHTTGVLTASLPSSIQQGVLGWYSNTGYESWNLLSYGNSYTTPVIYFDTTFYVNANPGSINSAEVGNGTLTGAQPFVFTSGYSRGRMLFLQDEIGYTGTVTSISLYVTTAATGADGIPVKLYMKGTDLTTLPTAAAAVDWDVETQSATLVYDGRIFFDHTGWYDIELTAPFAYNGGGLMVMTETNCADYCTGTGTQCNNCGAYVSGTTGYPVFRQTQVTGFCQYKNGNTASAMTGNYTAYNRRLNMKFNIADLDCGSLKLPIYVHVPDIPTYDVETQELVYPVPGTSHCTMNEENIQVQVKNLLNTSIPANKVVVHAVINGTEITQTVEEAFAPEEVKVVTFNTPYNFAAPTADITFNMTIFTTMNNEAVVYTGNDTITASLTSTRTARFQRDPITYTGAYTQTYTIVEAADRPTGIGVTNYYFYTSEDATTPFYSTPNNAADPTWTTPALYDTVTYWVDCKTQGSNCYSNRVPVIINVFRPQYDLMTNSLKSPTDYQCAVATSPQIQVNVGNADTTASSVIPAGTFSLTANFTGAANATGNTVISTPISHLQNTDVAFTVNNLSSATQNRTYQYTIYSNPTNNNMGVYRGNDTITGTLHIPANPTAPQALTYTVPYGTTYTVTPSSNVLDYFYFYETANGDPFAQGASFTTDPIYGSTTFYYSGRIEDSDFENTIQTGAGTVNNAAPFYMQNGHSYAKILYAKSELGAAGRIDTISVNVLNANTSGVSIPVKIWMKNANTDVECLTAGSVNWTTETSGAQLIYDGEMSFDQTGWLAIPVMGGFDYNGEGLFIYTEHDCGGSSCLTGLGVNPEPKFQNTQYSAATQKKVLQKYQNTALTAATSFTLIQYRWNTKFKFSYTCESPKSTITLNTSVPQHDVAVTDIVAPVEHAFGRTANEQVRVTIKNNGSTAASNFPVSYQFNNGTPVTQNYTGSIAAGASATMTFNTTVDLTSVYFCMPFKAYTGMTNDSFHGNDTLSIEVCGDDPCISRPASNYNTGAEISNVNFAGINNGTGTPYVNYTRPTGCDGLYTDYTNLTPGEIVKGQTYPLSVTHSFETATGTTVYKKVYIDFNRDGDFSDADECVFTSAAIPYAAGGSNATTSTNVTIPTTAVLGMTRMRVICSAGSLTANNSPCGTYNYNGETEDYAIEIKQPYGKDMGIFAYDHPVGQVCPDTNAKIRITVKNLGTEDQTFSNDNQLTLTTTVTGPHPGTYTATLNSGTVPVGGTRQIVMDNVNLSSAGTYHLSTQLTYAGDLYPANDTMSVNAVVITNTATTASGFATIPFSQDFDQNNNDAEDWLPAGWFLENSNNNYKWKCYKGESPLSANGYGPQHDHTYTDAPNFYNYAHYFAVSYGSNATTYASHYTALTSGCINLHYKNGYPVEVDFYKFFRGATDADFNMTVEVGSGSYYIPMDTLTKADGDQVSNTSPWSQHVTTLNGYDEVGRIRFRMTGQHNRIDPAIDDIGVNFGLPDLAVASIVYPYAFTDTVDHPDNCLQIGDTLHPVIRVKNNGNSDISNFQIMCVIKAQGANEADTLLETVTDVLAPGATMDYTFVSGHEIVDSRWVECNVYGIISYDKNLANNNKRVISCSNTGIGDYEDLSGMQLMQNVPNPAATTTSIQYVLPEYGKATLNIYTALGQLMYSDTQEGMQGSNMFEVNTANLADGIYYYTLTFKDYILTKKMVIQK